MGTARVDRQTRSLLRRLRAGDVAVLDQVDLDRVTADALVRAQVAAVVNAAPSISGKFPNLGPEVLLEAGIPLIDGVGADVLRIRDGGTVRVHEGAVYAGGRRVAAGTLQTPESIADLMVEARAGMSAQLEAFSADLVEFLHRERGLVLDGVGVPELRVPLQDRHVIVVAPGPDHRDDLRTLSKYIAEHRPVLIGVESAADTLRECGHTPDIIVGDPNGIEAATLKAGGEVVVPAQADGHAPGIERIQDLGIGAVTFPSSSNPEDLALLLADAHRAGLVVTVGFQATLAEFLDRGRSGSTPSTFLTRLKLGTSLVDGKAVAALHRNRVSLGAITLLVLAALVAVAVALLLSDIGDVYLNSLVSAWNTVVHWVGGLLG
jgi:uncharacterized membrane-anchored protein